MSGSGIILPIKQPSEADVGSESDYSPFQELDVRSESDFPSFEELDVRGRTEYKLNELTHLILLVELAYAALPTKPSNSRAAARQIFEKIRLPSGTEGATEYSKSFSTVKEEWNELLRRRVEREFYSVSQGPYSSEFSDLGTGRRHPTGAVRPAIPTARTPAAVHASETERILAAIDAARKQKRT
jgi:hypothetical protein